MSDSKNRRCAPITAAVLLCASACSSKADVTDLLRLSDTVVIATATAITAQANATLITLSVLSWLSLPPAGSPASVSVVWKAQPVLPAQGTASATAVPGIWYLTDQGNGTYAPQAATNVHSVTGLYQRVAARGTCPSALSYVTSVQLAEKIALELACAAALDLDNADYQVARNLVGAFGLASSQVVRNAFLYLAQLPGSRQKGTGIACLIAVGDASALPLLEQNLPHFSDQDLTRIVAPPLGACPSIPQVRRYERNRTGT
jgi:hypothetical protein